MINTLDAYEDAGRRAALSSNQRDAGTAHFHQTWFIEALEREEKADRPAARAAYDRGYHAARIV